MEQNQKLLDLTNVSPWVKIAEHVYRVKVSPFCYKGEKKKRLPRKSSKHYNLHRDVTEFFKVVSGESEQKIPDPKGRYQVDIKVYKGKDILGGADLDNYCKALLDGITQCKRFWKDDRQVDEIHIKRLKCEAMESYIIMTVARLE